MDYDDLKNAGIGAFIGFSIITLIQIQNHVVKIRNQNTNTIINLERCQVELEKYKGEIDLSLRENWEEVKVGE